MRRLLALLMLMAIPTAVEAQHGLVLDENGERHPPTPASAMKAVMEGGPGQSRYEPVVALLRQQFDPRSDAELDAIVDELVKVILDGDVEPARHATVALILASRSDDEYEGVRHPGAVDGLVRVYESAQSDGDENTFMHLDNIATAGNVAYVADVFESTLPPPPCTPRGGAVNFKALAESGVDPDNLCPNVSEWCDAAVVLTRLDHALAPEEEVLDPLCGWGRWIRH